MIRSASDSGILSPAAQILENYFRAKDSNRPHLLERVFCVDAQVEVTNLSSAIAFPAITKGRERIAEVLVGGFGRDNENVYSFYLSPPPDGAVSQFSCFWLVGMTEKSSKSVRVGCGTYLWTLSYDGTPCAKALVITIKVMQVVPNEEASRVMAWLEQLEYPWASWASAANSAPAIDGLKPVLECLNQMTA